MWISLGRAGTHRGDCVGVSKRVNESRVLRGKIRKAFSGCYLESIHTFLDGVSVYMRQGGGVSVLLRVVPSPVCEILYVSPHNWREEKKMVTFSCSCTSLFP